jgi:hypothetical protein
MKNKKSIFAIILVLLVMLMMPNVAAKSKEKVKVYIFEAGGCPYCEAQIEYLKGLSSYNKKFEIVQKELYVDHIDWEPGKDYELGKEVATQFNEAGFEDAAYTGTPFVVISDLYAAASYSTDLEAIINKAAEEGDKDIVSCIASKKESCLEGVTNNFNGVVSADGETTKEASPLNTVGVIAICAVAVAVIGLCGALAIKSAKED